MIEIINTATDEIVFANKEFKDYFQANQRKWVAGSYFITTRKLQKPFWKRLDVRVNQPQRNHQL